MIQLEGGRTLQVKNIFGQKFRFWIKKIDFVQTLELDKKIDFGQKIRFWAQISILNNKYYFDQ